MGSLFPGGVSSLGQDWGRLLLLLFCFVLFCFVEAEVIWIRAVYPGQESAEDQESISVIDGVIL